MLGHWWSERGVRIDAIYAGPHQRQRETARLIAAAGGYPEPIACPELAEHDTPGILRSALPALAKENPDLAREVGGADPFQSVRPFQLVFAFAMLRWAGGGALDEGVETHRDFCARVDGALARIRDAQGRGKTVVAVTSAGPVARALQSVLGLAHEATFRLNLIVANASVTDLRWRDGEITLMGFNAVAHLVDRVTYR